MALWVYIPVNVSESFCNKHDHTFSFCDPRILTPPPSQCPCNECCIYITKSHHHMSMCTVGLRTVEDVLS